MDLSYWDARTLAQCTSSVTGVDQVRDLADRLLREYGNLRTYYPGIEIRRVENEPGNSMSIAVAPFGMALFVTDENLDQSCSIGDHPGTGENPEVYWGEPTHIPWRHFVPHDTALACIAEWLRHQTLSALIQWCDDCA